MWRWLCSVSNFGWVEVTFKINDELSDVVSQDQVSEFVKVVEEAKESGTTKRKHGGYILSDIGS